MRADRSFGTLRTLNLSYNRIADDTVDHLLRVIAQNNHQAKPAHL